MFDLRFSGVTSATEGVEQDVRHEGAAAAALPPPTWIAKEKSALRDVAGQVMEKEKIMKTQSQIKHANQEKMIMMGLEHPNIVRLWYAFQTPSKM